MHQRDTFTVTEPGNDLDDHLWIIVSDPDEYPYEVVCFNVSSSPEFFDPACVVVPDDHSWIRRNSYIYYRKPKVVADVSLNRLCASKLITPFEPVSYELWARVLRGAVDTTHLEFKMSEILDRQGLIEL